MGFGDELVKFYRKNKLNESRKIQVIQAIVIPIIVGIIPLIWRDKVRQSYNIPIIIFCDKTVLKTWVFFVKCQGFIRSFCIDPYVRVLDSAMYSDRRYESSARVSSSSIRNYAG